MAFLTFAKAKVVAPPIGGIKYDKICDNLNNRKNKEKTKRTNLKKAPPTGGA